MPGLSRGVGQVEGGIAKSVKRKKISGLEGEKFMSSLIGTIDYDRFKEVLHTQMTQIAFSRQMTFLQKIQMFLFKVPINFFW